MEVELAQSRGQGERDAEPDPFGRSRRDFRVGDAGRRSSAQRARRWRSGGARAGTGQALIRQVALLRAINVGGRSIVKMADVQAAFTKAGCTNVSTYIASGNVIFDAPAGDAAALRRRISRGMRALLGAEPVIVYRTGNELQKLVDAAPFGALADDRAITL